jgi:hypothetical protein
VVSKKQRHHRYSRGAIPGRLGLFPGFCVLWAAIMIAAMTALG